MDWLRCNKCYNVMAEGTRKFVMTQCGHVFCEPCLVKSPQKCYVCGTTDFRALPLGWPPKLETTINYFSSVMDFAEPARKAAQFHEDQLIIYLRAFKELKKKYEYGKRAFAELMKKIEEKSHENTKLQEEIEQVKSKTFMHMQRSLGEHRHRPVANRHPNLTAEKPQLPRKYDAREDQIGPSIHRSGSTAFSNVSVASNGSQMTNRPMPMKSTQKSTPKMFPKYPHQPHPAFTVASHEGMASMTDSGCGTAMDEATPSSTSQRIFVVPSIQKVPKSVACVRRKARTLARLSSLGSDRTM